MLLWLFILTEVNFMNDLVFIKDEVPVVSTFDLFSRLGYADHASLKKTIDRNISAFNQFGVMSFEVQKPTSSKGGRPVKAYLLDENQFTFLAMMMKNTKEVVALKIDVAKAFIKMRNQLANIASRSENLEKVRQDGIGVYHQKTDIIKDFVSYAESQGSKSANMYYVNLAKMENKALFIFEQKYKNLREVLTIKQLMQVATADQLIENAIKEGLENKLHYKEIFKLAKNRVIQFAEIIGKSQILSLENKAV